MPHWRSILLQISSSRRRRFHPAGPGGRKGLQPVDEGPQVALLAGDRGLDLPEMVFRRLRVALEQAARYLQLQGHAGQGLQQAVMKIPRQSDSLFRGRGPPQSLLKSELVHAGHGQPRDDLAENDVVQGHPQFVQGEEPPFNRGSGESPGHDGSDVEPRPQCRCERRACPLPCPAGGVDEDPGGRVPGVQTEEVRARQRLGDERSEGIEPFVGPIENAVRKTREAESRLSRMFPRS